MVGQDVELRARERALFSVLQDWPDVQAVAVGGYAASAWSFPRFSHDLDFVAAAGDAPTVREHLKTHRLAPVIQRPAIEQNYGGAWERWQHGEHDITIDLLINSIQDRDFKVPMPVAELWRDHAKRPIRGLSQSGVELPVISKESLMALKCQPMRPRDIGDICAVAYTGYDADRLKHLLAPIIATRRELFRGRIEALRRALGTTPADLHRVLAPRIPNFGRIRNDMQTTIDHLLARLDRWSSR